MPIDPGSEDKLWPGLIGEIHFSRPCVDQGKIGRSGDEKLFPLKRCEYEGVLRMLTMVEENEEGGGEPKQTLVKLPIGSGIVDGMDLENIYGAVEFPFKDIE